MKKILFITPYFGRTGSEMQLFYLLNSLDRQKYQPYLFSRDCGILLKNLPADIPHSPGYKKHPNVLFRVLRLVLYALGINPVEFQLRKIHKRFKPDFWYINTIANRDALNLAKKLKVKLITHVHELPMSYSMVQAATIQNMVEHSTMAIGCSKIVCEKLEDMGMKNVHLLYGFIDNTQIKLDANENDIKKKLGISPNDFVWIVAGSASTTKGIDFLIPLLKELKPNHKIIWLGSTTSSGTSYYVEKSIETHFNQRVLFTGPRIADYYSYFNIGHACLSLSREDSFPLVLQEAAHLGKPIVGFNSGGISEFVNEQVGTVVDQLNFKDLAKAMAKVEQDYSKYDPAYIKQYAKGFNATQQAKELSNLFDTY